MKLCMKSRLHFKAVFCSFSFADRTQSVPEYLRAFPMYLKKEYMSKSVEEIFVWTDKLIMVSFIQMSFSFE